MANEYVQDNEGSGFVFDDDLDLNKMMDKASAASEDDSSDDDIDLFKNDDHIDEQIEKHPVNPHKRPNKGIKVDDSTNTQESDYTPSDSTSSLFDDVNNEDDSSDDIDSLINNDFDDKSENNDDTDVDEEQGVEDDTLEPLGENISEFDENNQSYDSSQSIDEDIKYEDQQEETLKSTVQEPIQKNVTENKVKELYIPSEEDEIKQIEKIVKIIDAYRRLDDNSKVVAVQFISSEDIDLADEAKVVVKVLHINKQLAISMKNLKEAKALTEVERAFYVMSLNDSDLHDLGKLVSTFTKIAPDLSLSKIDFSRNLVKDIENLSQRHIEYVIDVESLLSAGAEVE